MISWREREEKEKWERKKGKEQNRKREKEKEIVRKRGGGWEREAVMMWGKQNIIFITWLK